MYENHTYKIEKELAIILGSVSHHLHPDIVKYIKDKKSSIIDMGTGAGLPGLILAIYGYSNILLVDSKLKKIRFINCEQIPQKKQNNK